MEVSRQISSLLLKAGLSEAEIAVYLQLLKKPADTKWQLVLSTCLDKNKVYRACEKRPVSQQLVQELIDRIFNSIMDEYEREVPSMVIGERVMNGLRVIDQVAYVRFASVYRRFAEATEFVQEVQKLETTR